MPIVSMRQLLDHAAENSYGLPAFNVNNMEQVWAIMEAANQVDAPVIMRAPTSAGRRRFSSAQKASSDQSSTLSLSGTWM